MTHVDDWNDHFVLAPPGWRGWVKRAMYALGHGLSGLAFRTLWRLRVEGRENVPLVGPLLIAANHASFIDPPLVGSSLPRPLYYMGKEELFRWPVFGWIISQVNAFPIRRKEGDVGAIRTAHRILAAGGALIVFPEGRRQRGGEFGRPKGGVGLLAVKTGAPVVPAYLHGNHRAWRFPRLRVVFGKPLAAAPGETGEAFAHRVMNAIRDLKESLRGSLVNP